MTMTNSIKTAMMKAAAKKEDAVAIKTEALSPELIKAVAAMVAKQNAEIAAKQQVAEPAKPISTYDTARVNKMHIEPLEVTIRLTVSKVSETGTLSGIEIEEVKCGNPNVDLKVFSPRPSPHSIMMQVHSLDGLKKRGVIETGTPTGNKRKLF